MTKQSYNRQYSAVGKLKDSSKWINWLKVLAAEAVWLGHVGSQGRVAWLVLDVAPRRLRPRRKEGFQSLADGYLSSKISSGI